MKRIPSKKELESYLHSEELLEVINEDETNKEKVDAIFGYIQRNGDPLKNPEEFWFLMAIVDAKKISETQIFLEFEKRFSTDLFIKLFIKYMELQRDEK